MINNPTVIVSGGVVTDKSTGTVLPGTTLVAKPIEIPEQTITLTKWRAKQTVYRDETLPYSLGSGEFYEKISDVIDIPDTINCGTYYACDYYYFIKRVMQIAKDNFLEIKTKIVDTIQKGCRLVSLDEGRSANRYLDKQAGISMELYVRNGVIYPAEEGIIYWTEYYNGTQAKMNYIEGVTIGLVGKSRGLSEYVVGVKK